MARASPNSRRSYSSHPQSSPDRGYLSELLSEERHSVLTHQAAIEAAQAEHERVRNAANRVYQLHELQEQTRRIQLEAQKEHDRLKAEAEVVAEQKRLRELRARQIPKLPPTPELPKVQLPPPKAQPAPQVNGAAAQIPNKANPFSPGTSKLSQSLTPSAPVPSIEKEPKRISPFAVTPTPDPTPAAALKPSPAPQSNTANGFPPSQPAPVPKQTLPNPFGSNAAQAAPIKPPSTPVADRYTQIHQELKKLRKEVEAQGKALGSPLKGKLGEMRRQIRKSIGQLTGGKGANVQPTNTIIAALRASLDSRLPSQPVDVSRFVQDKREPTEGAVHNDAYLPSLFLYLMNVFSKAIILQFINEGGANTKAAEPVGIVAAQIFSNKDFHWRGISLIDILMAKFRIACPVLFGFRGSDKTQGGRAAIGWKKEEGQFITEQTHNDRMTGLGAGFASIALRDFSKASKTNPYPPTNYWKAMAGIVNSPAQLVSNTQYVVLKSMIDGHEQRFLNFYGNAAIAALRMALVEFPKKAPERSTAAAGLVVLADVLRRDMGLNLD